MRLPHILYYNRKKKERQRIDSFTNPHLPFTECDDGEIKCTGKLTCTGIVSANALGDVGV